MTCKECHSETGKHRAGCPNAPEPRAVFQCECCGACIKEGDGYYELHGDYYHEECFMDNAVGILEGLGAVYGTAEYDECEGE